MCRKVQGRHLVITLMDKDLMTDDQLGEVSIPFTHYQDQVEHDDWFRIPQGGEIHVRACWVCLVFFLVVSLRLGLLTGIVDRPMQIGLRVRPCPRTTWCLR
jgi:hypothetical protein